MLESPDVSRPPNVIPAGCVALMDSTRIATMLPSHAPFLDTARRCLAHESSQMQYLLPRVTD